MTTLPTAWLSSLDPRDDATIPQVCLVYLQERLRSRVYDAVMMEFEKASIENALTQAKLARRLGRRPEQITRWLSSPGNWTLDTISNLLAAINGKELVAETKYIPGIDTQKLFESSILSVNLSEFSSSAQIEYDLTGFEKDVWFQISSFSDQTYSIAPPTFSEDAEMEI
ncbi:helix-turn-helix domain-containing protein [Methylobacterium sp. NPDC080182]|uniref:helix-turn-helix domain-containing protein n=1 Tax=Methylobacterium sp. NPDC080182 TaxID=3390590 RepID=UPI003D050895